MTLSRRRGDSEVRHRLAAVCGLPLALAHSQPLGVHGGGALRGVGVGLFIDEVGKFITQSNDYFFPAAPIIYAFFLLTVMLYLQVRRLQPRDARAELYYVLDAFGEVLDRDLDAQECHDLDTRLRRVIRDADQQPDITRLAGALRGFLVSDALCLAPASSGFWEQWSRRLRTYEARWVSPRRLKGGVVGGLGVSGL